MKTVEQLEEKIWYRFLKLIFVFGYVLSVAFFSFLAYSTPPLREFFIYCDNGKIYPAGPDWKKDIFDDIHARLICGGMAEKIVVDIGDEVITIIPLPGLSPGEALKEAAKRDKKIADFISDKRLVENEKTSELALWDGKNLTPVKVRTPKVRELRPDEKIDPLPEKNYKFEMRESYKKAVRTFLYGLLAVVVCGEIMRRSFFYVAIGKPFFLIGRRKTD